MYSPSKTRKRQRTFFRSSGWEKEFCADIFSCHSSNSGASVNTASRRGVFPRSLIVFVTFVTFVLIFTSFFGKGKHDISIQVKERNYYSFPKRFSSWNSKDFRHQLVRLGIMNDENQKEITAKPLNLPEVNPDSPESKEISDVVSSNEIKSSDGKLLSMQKSRIWYQYVDDAKFTQDMLNFALYSEKNITGMHVTNRGDSSYHGPKTFHLETRPFARKAIALAIDLVKKSVLSEARKNYIYENMGGQYLPLTYEDITVTCDHAWVNINTNDARNLWHAHPGSDHSVVFYAQTAKGSTIRFKEDNVRNRPGIVGSIQADRPGLMVTFPSFLYHDVPPTGEVSRRISYAFDFKVKIDRKPYIQKNYPLDFLSVYGIDKKSSFVEVENKGNDVKEIRTFGSFTIGQALMHHMQTKHSSANNIFDALNCGTQGADSQRLGYSQHYDSVEQITLPARRLSKAASWSPHPLAPRVVGEDTDKSIVLERCARKFTSVTDDDMIKAFVQKSIHKSMHSLLPMIRYMNGDSFIHTYVKQELLKDGWIKRDLVLEDVNVVKIEKISIKRESGYMDSPTTTEQQGIVRLDSIPFDYESTEVGGDANVCGCNSMMIRGIMSIGKETSSSSTYSNSAKVCGVMFEDRRREYRPFTRAIGKRNSFGNYYFPTTYEFGRFMLPITHEDDTYSLTTFLSTELHKGISKLVIGGPVDSGYCSFAIVEACVKLDKPKARTAGCVQ